MSVVEPGHMLDTDLIGPFPKKPKVESMPSCHCELFQQVGWAVPYAVHQNTTDCQQPHQGGLYSLENSGISSTEHCSSYQKLPSLPFLILKNKTVLHTLCTVSTFISVLYNSCMRAYLLRSLPGLIGCNIILNKTKVFKTGGRSSLPSFTVVDRFCLCWDQLIWVQAQAETRRTGTGPG